MRRTQRRDRQTCVRGKRGGLGSACQRRKERENEIGLDTKTWQFATDSKRWQRRERESALKVERETERERERDRDVKCKLQTDRETAARWRDEGADRPVF